MTTLGELLRDRHVLVCCGTGGVGKTTTAAVLALERRALPDATRSSSRSTPPSASRTRSGWTSWATSRTRSTGRVGTPTAPRRPAVGSRRSCSTPVPPSTRWSTATRADPSRHSGSSRTASTATSPAPCRARRSTWRWRSCTSSTRKADYDLIVVDTPPTRHALDFLDAPARLTRLLDNRIFRFLMVPARTGAARRRRRGAGVPPDGRRRWSAREVIDDIVAFFRAFEGMEQGFRERARACTALLADPATGFVLVTSPRRDAVEEAEFFADRLRASQLAVAGAGREPRAPALREDLDLDRLTSVRRARGRAEEEGGDAACRPACASRRGTRTSPTTPRSPHRAPAARRCGPSDRRRGGRVRAVPRARRRRLRRARRGRRRTCSA